MEKPKHISVSRNCSSICTNTIFTCSQILNLPELEDGSVEDWDKYEHVPGREVVNSSNWLPHRASELDPSRTRICIEIGQIVSEKDKMCFQEIQNYRRQNLPESFLPADTEKVGVAELWVEHDGDAEDKGDGGQGRNQQFPHLCPKNDQLDMFTL